MSRLWLAIVSCALVSLLAVPQGWAGSALTIVTGAKTGTYYAIGRDIAEMAARRGMTVSVDASQGSVDNIKRVNNSSRPAVGIVQSDVLGFLKRSQNPASMQMAERLRMIFPLYHEEVHVLARNAIAGFADLKGKKVAIGQENSGSMLTALNLFSMMGVEPVAVEKLAPAEGVVQVLEGKLDAVIFVGGKPVRLFKNLENLALPPNQRYAAMLEGVHFLPLNDPKMLAEYSPAEITPADYHFVHKPVPTIAVQAVLMGYDFSKETRLGHGHCKQVARLADIIRQSMPLLRKQGHPKWKQTDLNADAGLWKRDSCAWGREKP